PMPPMPRIYANWGGFGGGGRWGEMQLTPMNAGLASYFGTDKGLLVLRAAKDSRLQLQDGDVILDIDGRSPDSPSQAMRILGSYGPGETVKLDIMRKGKPVTLNVALPKSRDDYSSSSAFNFTVQSDDDDGAGGR
ncbi:MAG: PDZ domain-containing protein, partial [Gammaproteobacteria bacterium]